MKKKVITCTIIVLFFILVLTSMIQTDEGKISSTISPEAITKNLHKSQTYMNLMTSTANEQVIKRTSVLQNPPCSIAEYYGCDVTIDYWFSSVEYLAPSILPTFPSGSDIDLEGNWYAVDYAGGIYQIFYDGYQVFVATSMGLNSLTFDPWRECWYGCDASYLYLVNITTGETNIIGALNVPNTIIGISCILDGELYGYDILWTGSSTLYSINPDTGACTVIGSMGHGFIYAQDCCFDRDNDILYIWGYFNDGSPPAVLICDVETSGCVIVGMLFGEIDAITYPYEVSGWMLYPRANYTWDPPSPYPGVTIFFNASGSVDDDGYITLYEWDWNNDSVYDETLAIPTTTHLWLSPGDYPVTLQVTDNMGLTATKTYSVQILSNTPSPPVIYGPDEGFVNISYLFTTDPIMDPNGDSFYCQWDWGDENITDWLGPYPSGSIITASHTWEHLGVYAIRAKLKSGGGESDWSEPHNISIHENQSPESPTITGPSVGRVGVFYNFTVSITNPEANQYYFIIDWGDGDTSGWLGPYEAGEQVKLSHAWYIVGTYLIQVKAKDSQGTESNTALWNIQIVELKKSILLGIFRNQSETEDLRIFITNFLICIPSESFVHFGVPVAIVKENQFGFIGSLFFVGIFETAILE
jgi:PKD repeat protein